MGVSRFEGSYFVVVSKGHQTETVIRVSTRTRPLFPLTGFSGLGKATDVHPMGTVREGLGCDAVRGCFLTASFAIIPKPELRDPQVKDLLFFVARSPPESVSPRHNIGRASRILSCTQSESRNSPEIRLPRSTRGTPRVRIRRTRKTKTGILTLYT